MTSTPPSELGEARASIRSLVARHAPIDGTHETPLDGVRLFRVSAPVERVPGVYNPSVCIIAAGSKLAFHDGRTYTYDPERYLCATVPTPVEAEIPRATPVDPVLGILIDLGSRTTTELMIRYRAANPRPPDAADTSFGLTVAAWDQRFETALLRALELLDEPMALGVLGEGRLRELLYTIVEGPAGRAIRTTVGAPSHQLVHVLTSMRDHLDEPLAVEDLADRAGMSRAAFDRHFKATTTMSPLRFLKALRLNEAAMLISNGANITQAASRVGYTSLSQFSREFKRHFGASPRTWSAVAGAADPQVVAAG